MLIPPENALPLLVAVSTKQKFVPTCNSFYAKLVDISRSQKVRISKKYRWSKKNGTVYDTIILQPYITESCGFQQNVLKEILYMTKVSV